MRLRRPAAAAHIVISDKSHGLPYSKGLMASSVMMAGVAPAQAYRVAEKVEQVLNERGVRQIASKELRDLAASLLAQIDERHASSYLQWQAVEELDQPLIILLGGGTGVGKSTVATQLAARLGIVRVISTDAIREVMKGTFSKEFMPTLYTSSFDTGDVVKVKSTRADDAVLVGFRDQVSAVSVGVNALIERAVNEGTDVIIEGAHIVPGFITPDAFAKKAVIVWAVVQVEDEALHRSHFYVRAHETRSRPVERYLAHFPEIRKIQKYIKSLALQHGVPIISNYNLDACIGQVIEHVIDSAVEAGKGRPQRKVRAIRGGSR